MDIQVKDQFEKIANLVAYDVPQTQIAAAVGLSESRVSQIISSPEFLDILQLKTLEHVEKHKTLNDGWDMAENLALNTVITTLQNAPDPDFALKAAVVANKAHRRGHVNNRPIEGRAGVRAVINLNMAFINRLQDNFKITKHETATLEQKESNFLSPKSVQSLLKPKAAIEIQEDLPEDDLVLPPEFAMQN